MDINPTNSRDGSTILVRSLKSAELNYSTIKRELLGVLFGIKKFREYLQGRSFIIKTDHQPLVSLLHKPIATIANERLRDMIADLFEFNFEVVYVPGKENQIADFLDRVP